MKRNMQGVFHSNEKRSRILSLLILPAAAVLFGILSGTCGDLVSVSIHILLSENRQPNIFWTVLNALGLACLLALLVFHILNTLRMFRRKTITILAVALIFTPLVLFFPNNGTVSAAAWLSESIFLLFAAQTTLQMFLLPPDIRYKGTGFRVLLLLLLVGSMAIISQVDTFDWDIITAYTILVVIYLTLTIVCKRKQRNIQLMQNALDDSAMVGNLKSALRTEELRELLPYFRFQMSEGSSIAKLLILELIRGAQFDGKEDLAKAAFISGPLEVQFAVVDQIFSWSLPYQLLVFVVENCSDPLAEYLVRKMFLYYPDITDHGILEELLERADCMRNFQLNEEARRMFAYVFDGKRNEYSYILDTLLRSDRKEDRLFAVEIMSSFIGREDHTNRKHLVEVIENTFLNPAELEEMIELCAEYDINSGYLKKHLSNYYNYDFLKKISEYYEPLTIAKSFSGISYPIPIALTLLAACRLDQNGMGVYREKLNHLFEYLMRLGIEESKILAAGFSNAKLLLDEIKWLRRTLLTVVVEYKHIEENGVRTENSLEKIALDNEMEWSSIFGNIAEFPEIPSKEILAEGDFNYEVLMVSINNTLLESIYRYLGGEVLETRLTENIEKLISLKSIPMFSNLDIFTLQQIQKISVYKKIPAGESIIIEGEEGTSLYIVINGKVGVYKGGKLINEIGTGGILGEMAIIEKQRRSATIKTLDITNFLIIEGDDFIKLLERNSSISMSVIKTLAGRLRNMLENEK